MNRRFLAALLVAVTVVVQVCAVNRLALPWGAAPDLVLLAVTGIALRTTAVTGAVAGCAAGLAVGVAPPADSELGRYALALCLVGYVVGTVREPVASSPLWPLGVAAAATVAVSAAFALLGLVLGDPRVTLAAVATELPVTLLMTMAAAPFVLYPVRWAMRRLVGDDFAAIGDAPWATTREMRW